MEQKPNLIDRDATKNHIKRRVCNNCEYYGAICNACDVQDALDAIDDMAAIDAAPVVHGEWVPTFHEYANKFERCMIADEFHCSQCGVYSKMKSHYCPNCGADMRGRKDDGSEKV